MFLISCLQPTPVPLKHAEPSMQEGAETPTSAKTLDSEAKAQMTPEELRDLIESGYFKDESNMPTATEKIPAVQAAELPQPETATGASLLNRCTQVCVRHGEVDGADKKTMELLPSACHSSCATVAMYAGEEKLLPIIKDYEASIEFHQNLNAGFYDNDIEQCAVWKADAITARNNHWHFQGNYAEAHQKQIDAKTLKSECRQRVRDWVLEENQEYPLGTEFKEQADLTKAVERKVTNECYPTVHAYKTAVFTKRNELDQHDVEKETISDCLLKVNQPEFYDYIEGLEKDIPNWQ